MVEPRLVERADTRDVGLQRIGKRRHPRRRAIAKLPAHRRARAGVDAERGRALGRFREEVVGDRIEQLPRIALRRVLQRRGGARDREAGGARAKRGERAAAADWSGKRMWHWRLPAILFLVKPV